jgi:hypothetical protein
MGLLDGVHGERVGKVQAKVFECVNPLHSCLVDVEGGRDRARVANYQERK